MDKLANHYIFGQLIGLLFPAMLPLPVCNPDWGSNGHGRANFALHSLAHAVLAQRQVVSPLRGKLFSRVVAYLANLGKPIAPFIGTSGLDDHS